LWEETVEESFKLFLASGDDLREMYIKSIPRDPKGEDEESF